MPHHHGARAPSVHVLLPRRDTARAPLSAHTAAQASRRPDLSVHMPLPLALEPLRVALQCVRLRKLLYAADHEAAHEQQDDGGPGRWQK